MPSPLNGLIEPAASPTTSHVGPTFGSIEPPIGSRPPVGIADAARRGQISQYSGRGARELVHEVGRVDALEVAERRQQADADVDRAVADREDPAVAGQRVAVAVADVERALDPRVGVQRALVVAADRHALRVARGRARCRAPGRTASWRRRRPRRSGVDRTFWPAPCPSRPRRDEPTVDTERSHRLGALPERGAGLHGVLGDHLVEVAATHDVAVATGRSGARASCSSSVMPWATARSPSKRWNSAERSARPMSCELVHRPRRQAVAAGLLPRERLLLDDDDVVAGRASQ